MTMMLTMMLTNMVTFFDGDYEACIKLTRDFASLTARSHISVGVGSLRKTNVK